jgi:hypothetical protein
LSRNVIAVDLDGTLAEYHGSNGPNIGAPVPNMVAIVKDHLAQGDKVVIFTARASYDKPEYQIAFRANLRRWTRQHIGVELEATCVKELWFTRFYDDLAITVEKNTGRILTRPR